MVKMDSMKRFALPFVVPLLLLCLAPMPYGYYLLVRYVAMIVFAVLAHLYYKERQMAWSGIFMALAVLFQPFIKFALGRTMWNVVDVIIAVLLIVLWIKERNILTQKI